MEPSVFISYSRTDGCVHAEALYQALVAQGITAWRDERSLNPYTDFSVELEQAIRAATHVVVCVTPSLGDSPESFVRREIVYAQQKRKPIIPLVFDGATVPILINHLTWLAINDLDADLSVLLERIHRSEPVAGPEGDPYRPYLVALLEQIVAYLESTTYLLIPLRSREDPSAVAPTIVRAPVTLVSVALPVREPVRSAVPEPEPITFDDFGAVLDHFAGSVLLLGEPGAGKSTTLWTTAREAVTRRLADPDQPLPILAQIPTWDSARHTELAAWLGEVVHGLSAKAIEGLLRAGRATLFLDALDELGAWRQDAATGASFDPRPRFMQLLPPAGSVVVSCRVADYQEIGSRAGLRGAVVLQPLNDQQIAAILRDQPEVLALLDKDRELLEMLRTPLLLSVFAYAVNGLGNALPRFRTGTTSPLDRVFDLFLERRYEHEAAKPGSLPFPYREFRAVLDRAACHSTHDPIWGKSGIVTEVIVQDSLYPRLQLWRRFWFILAVLGLGRARAREFIRLARRMNVLLPARNGDSRFLHLLLRDSLAFRAAERDLTHRSVECRRKALHTLGRLGGAKAMEAVWKVYTTPGENMRVHFSAGFALEGMQHPTLRWRLVALAAQDRSDWHLIKTVVGREVVPVLVERLQSGDTTTIRKLGELGDRRAVESLLPLLDSRKWFERSAAATALGKIGDQRAIPGLRALLTQRDRSVRRAAAVALGMMGEQEVLPLLLRHLKKRERVTDTIEALGRIRHPDAVAPLIRHLRSSDLLTRKAAFEAIANFEDPRVYKALAHEIKSKKACADAAKALARMRNPAVTDAVRRAVFHREGVVRLTAIRVLGRRADAVATSILVEALAEGDPVTRFEAAISLGRAKNAAGIPALAALLDDHSPGSWGIEIAEAAAAALVMIDTPEARAAALRFGYPARWDRGFPPAWLEGLLAQIERYW